MFKQIINIPVNKKNEGILFPGNVIPASRPLHIYRKTGARCVSNLGTCTISDKPLKMLGKNKNGVFIPQDRCRNVVSKPYYPNYNNYVHRKCMPSLTPMYTIFNPNNGRFRTQGAVSESAFTSLKKYEAIIANNQSLLTTYKINLKYSENPVHTLKDDIMIIPQYNNNNCA
jgi:hypothetical protein